MAVRKKRSGRFLKGLLIYILIFVLLAAVALTVFSRYLKAFEESRVTTALNAHLSACAAGKLTYPWGLALGKLDAGLSAGSDSRTWAQEKIRNATVRELRSVNSDEIVYGLYDESGFCFNSITLRQTGEEHFGFTGWEVADETVNLEPYTTTVSVTVPETYTVEVGGTVLDRSFITETGIPYEVLQPFRDVLGTLPTLARYSYGPVLGAEALTVRDSAGKEVPEELQTEDHYLDNCTEADRQRVTDFVNRYLAAYLPYADDLNHAGMAYFYQVYVLIIPGGELEARIRQAQDGFEYGNVMGIDILSVNMDCCSDMGGGRYFTDFSYHIRTTGLNGPTEEDYRMKLLLKEQNGVLLAEAMYLD